MFKTLLQNANITDITVLDEERDEGQLRVSFSLRGSAAPGVWKKLLKRMVLKCHGSEDSNDFGISPRKEFYTEDTAAGPVLRFVWVVLVWGDLEEAETFLQNNCFQEEIKSAPRRMMEIPKASRGLIKDTRKRRVGGVTRIETTVSLPHRGAKDRNAVPNRDARKKLGSSGPGAYVDGVGGDATLDGEAGDFSL